MTFSEEEKRDYAISVIRDYKNFPYKISDEEIIDKYPLAVRIIASKFESQILEQNNIASIRNGNESITYNNNETTVINAPLKALLGLPYFKSI